MKKSVCYLAQRLKHRIGGVGGFFAQAKKVTALSSPRALTCYVLNRAASFLPSPLN